VSKGSGTTRGDRKRNARRERLRGLLPRSGAVVGIDLAEDKQALAVISSATFSVRSSIRWASRTPPARRSAMPCSCTRRPAPGPHRGVRPRWGHRRAPAAAGS